MEHNNNIYDFCGDFCGEISEISPNTLSKVDPKERPLLYEKMVKFHQYMTYCL